MFGDAFGQYRLQLRRAVGLAALPRVDGVTLLILLRALPGSFGWCRDARVAELGAVNRQRVQHLAVARAIGVAYRRLVPLLAFGPGRAYVVGIQIDVARIE